MLSLLFLPFVLFGALIVVVVVVVVVIVIIRMTRSYNNRNYRLCASDIQVAKIVLIGGQSRELSW